MKTQIDCLLIGHNEMNFSRYEENIRKMGEDSGAYRDLNLNFIQYDNKPYTASEIFNLFYCNGSGAKGLNKPFRVTETFNAAIAYLGTYLARRGFNFDYINAFQEEKEELKLKLQQSNILTVAIITTLYVSALPILEIIEFIKQYNRGARVIIGGPFVSTRVRTQDPATLDYLFRSIGADFYVNSAQGETALVNIIHSLKHHLPLDKINNIYYKTANGYQSTPFLQENNKLGENMVNWNLFSNRMGEYINARTSISCPFSCSFCGFPQHAGQFQTAPVEEIEKELNDIEEIGSVKCLHVIDDTFNVPLKRFEEILKMMIKNKYSFKWYSHYRCQFAQKETLELMKESGCEGVFLGIESGSDQILKNMRKAVNVEKYLKGISLLKEQGILVYGSFIIGFPGETEKTVKDTLQFIKEGGLDFYRTQLWYCEPLTPIWKEREKYKIQGESFEWSHATMDAHQAADIIEDIFCSIDTPTWIPQYNFEYDGIFHLLHRGKSLEKIITFLNAFNKGIEDKLKNPLQKEVSFEVIKQIKDSCQDIPDSHAFIENKNEFNQLEADFAF